MRTAAETIASAIRDALSSWGDGPACPAVLVEDKGDMLFELQSALESSGVYVTVATPGFTRRNNTAGILQGTLEIDVTAFENVKANREQPDFLTAQGIAQRIASALHWKKIDGFISPLRVLSIRRTDPSDAISSATVSLSAEYILS